MPTLITHLAPPLAARLGLGRDNIPRHLLIAGLFASLLPDLDVIAFRLGIPYAHILGHRGFSHSLCFACLTGLLALLFARRLHTSRPGAFTFVTLSAASHPLLDMLTNGGRGVALYWPWSATRHFAAWRPIEVSPLNPVQFFGARGIAVALSELQWVWLPALACALMLYGLRHYGGRLVPASAAGRRQAGLLLIAGSLGAFVGGLLIGGADGHEYIVSQSWTIGGFVLTALTGLGALGLRPLPAPRASRFALPFSLLAGGILLLTWLYSASIVAGIGQMQLHARYEGGISLDSRSFFILLGSGLAYAALVFALARFAPLNRAGIACARASLALVLATFLLSLAYLLLCLPIITWRGWA